MAFLAVCQGEMLSNRMEKVFSGFRVNAYPCPETLTERTEMMRKIGDRITDLEEVNQTLRTFRKQDLSHNNMISVRYPNII